LTASDFEIISLGHARMSLATPRNLRVLD